MKVDSDRKSVSDFESALIRKLDLSRLDCPWPRGRLISVLGRPLWPGVRNSIKDYYNSRMLWWWDIFTKWRVEYQSSKRLCCITFNRRWWRWHRHWRRGHGNQNRQWILFDYNSRNEIYFVFDFDRLFAPLRDLLAADTSQRTSLESVESEYVVCKIFEKTKSTTIHYFLALSLNDSWFF